MNCRVVEALVEYCSYRLQEIGERPLKPNFLPARWYIIFRLIALVGSVVLLLILASVPANKTIAVQANPTLTYTAVPTFTPTATPENPLITAANAAQLTPLRTWQAHVQNISSLSFSADQQHLLSTGNDQLNGTSPFRVWNRKSGQEVELAFEGIQPFAFAWTGQYSDDGLYILGSIGGVLGTSIWRASDGSRVIRIGQDGIDTEFVKLMGSDYMVIIGQEDGFVGVWGVSLFSPEDNPERAAMGFTYENLVEYQQEYLSTAFHIGEPLSSLTFNPDTRQVVALAQSGNLSVFTLQYPYGTLEAIQLEVPTNSPEAESISVGDSKIALKSNSSIYAFAGSYQDVVFWDYVTKATIARQTFENPIDCLTFSPDGELLIVTDYAVTSTIHILNASTGESLAVLNPGNSVTSCAFSPDGTLFATGSFDGEITLWAVV